MEEVFLEVLEAFWDVLKMLPALYLVYLLIVFAEHKFFHRSFKFGPLVGAGLGSIPQCGFSAVMSDMYSKRMITLGTLIAVFVATSDEAIPIMIANPDFIVPMLWMILIKFVVAVIFGYSIDLILRKWRRSSYEISKCEDVHCGCHQNIFVDALKHTVNIAMFLFIATAIINIVVLFVGIDGLSVMFGNNVYVEVVMASLIGLLPSCAASVFLVELFMSGAMSFAALLAGLTAGSGVGLLVLLNKNKKRVWENIIIIALMLVIGIVVGIVFSFIPLAF